MAPTSPGPPGTTVVMDAVEFCRLMAGRHAPTDLRADVSGDTSAAEDMIQVASTLGCD